MSALIIHPRDLSTTFLTPIYQDIANANVIVDGYDDEQIINALNESDRVLMMGHGSPGGLFSVGNFRTRTPYVISHLNARQLQAKDENVFIWCNADKYVERHNLTGFYTGMFISEVSEAQFCGVFKATQDMVDESNDLFAHIMSKYINDKKHTLFNNVRNDYAVLIKHNPVAHYNWKRLYVK